MGTESQAIEVLARAIVDAASTAASSATFDKTRYGVITGVDGHTYSVCVNGSEYCVSDTGIFNIGQRVPVTFVQNDPHHLRIGAGGGSAQTVVVTDIEGGHRITVTDANGSTSVDVVNGVGSVIDQNSGSAIQFWYGTISEYNALGSWNDNTVYNILEEAIT